MERIGKRGSFLKTEIATKVLDGHAVPLCGKVPSQQARFARGRAVSEWLVARVMTNVEDAVTHRLSRVNVESYWPKFRERLRDPRTHRTREITRPLYPCYLFVRTNPFYFLFDVEGIIGVVMHGPVPAVSTSLDNEIARMRAGECDGFVSRPVVEEISRLRMGSRVVILNGVLRGHLGVCQELRGSRAKVVTNMFGGETPVWHSERDLAVA